MLCQDLMNRKVTLIKSDTPCREIMSLLAEDPSRPLLVANDAGFLLGVVHAKNLLRLHLERTRQDPLAATLPAEDDQALRLTMERLAKATAKDLMIEAPIVAQVDTSVASVILSMFQQNLNIVPVVREGRLAGSIGRAEILRFMLQMMPA